MGLDDVIDNCIMLAGEKLRTDQSEERRQESLLQGEKTYNNSLKEEQQTQIQMRSLANASRLTRVTFSYSTRPSHPTHLIPIPATLPLRIDTVITPREEVIYYPVIHNRILLTPRSSPNYHSQRSSKAHITPIRKGNGRIENKDVMTPQQFRRLSAHSKK